MLRRLRYTLALCSLLGFAGCQFIPRCEVPPVEEDAAPRVALASSGCPTGSCDGRRG